LYLLFTVRLIKNGTQQNYSYRRYLLNLSLGVYLEIVLASQIKEYSPKPANTIKDIQSK